jgi:indolepyruvate ferredoxin oxidoreductase
MLGYAAQKGVLPVSLVSLKEAIRLNGSFVEGNLRTFDLGRLAAHAPDALAKELAAEEKPVPLATVDDVLASRMPLLTAYQNDAYAQLYAAFVADTRRRTAALKGGETFTREVALTLARLMAYKDEYEVARLHTDPKFTQRLRTQFAGDFKTTFHLAPPLIPGRDASGRPKKRAFPGATVTLFRLLAAMKTLRGTALDIFGYTHERKLERRLIENYRALIERLLPRLNEFNIAAATEIAHAASEIRGYGPVKDASYADYEKRLTTLLGAFESASRQTEAA